MAALFLPLLLLSASPPSSIFLVSPCSRLNFAGVFLEKNLKKFFLHSVAARREGHSNDRQLLQQLNQINKEKVV